MITTVLADDQAEARALLRRLLQSDDAITIVGEASDGDEAVSLTRDLRPDVLLLDIRMPERDGLAVLRDLRAGDSSTHVIMLTSFDLDEYVFTALEHGAAGFLTKNAPPADLRRAVHAAAAGQGLIDPAVTRRVITEFARQATTPSRRRLSALTRREHQVAELIAEGMANDEIADTLSISSWTVKTHVSHILAKLDGRERVHIAIAILASKKPH